MCPPDVSSLVYISDCYSAYIPYLLNKTSSPYCTDTYRLVAAAILRSLDLSSVPSPESESFTKSPPTSSSTLLHVTYKPARSTMLVTSGPRADQRARLQPLGSHGSRLSSPKSATTLKSTQSLVFKHPRTMSHGLPPLLRMAYLAMFRVHLLDTDRLWLVVGQDVRQTLDIRYEGESRM